VEGARRKTVNVNGDTVAELAIALFNSARQFSQLVRHFFEGLESVLLIDQICFIVRPFRVFVINGFLVHKSTVLRCWKSFFRAVNPLRTSSAAGDTLAFFFFSASIAKT
jgi:hypothetical protein